MFKSIQLHADVHDVLDALVLKEKKDKPHLIINKRDVLSELVMKEGKKVLK